MYFVLSTQALYQSHHKKNSDIKDNTTDYKLYTRSSHLTAYQLFSKAKFKYDILDL